MRLAVDTNVLVRYIAWDDDAQARKAEGLIERADIVVIPTVVLCETVWVLGRAYRYKPDEMAQVLSDLIASSNVEVDRAAAEAGLAMLARGRDFADGAVEHEALERDCAEFATFDEEFAERLSPRLRRR
jgi:predicted nucleic-acid-binding protein